MLPWQEIGDRIYRRRYESLDLNVGCVIGADGALIIDTRSTHREADELLAEVARLTPLPIRWVLDTHHHWDHTFGNARFPDAELWGHVRCRAVLTERGEQMRRDLIEMMPQDRRAEIAAVEIVPPDHLFATEAMIDLGDRTVELRHLGRGHTDNDVVAVVPGAGVVFAGDLVEEGNPPSFGDSFPLDWPGTLEALLGLVSATVVPGHGDVVDAGFVAAQAVEITSIVSLASRCHAEGMPLDRVGLDHMPYPEAVVRQAVGRAYLQLEDG